MRQNVIVSANAEGNVINMSKNPMYGYIVVKQNRIQFKSGFARHTEFTALITGEIRILEMLNFREGQELPGNIIVEESLTPFDGKHREGDLKRTRDGRYFTTFEGEPIYRRNVYDETGCREDDLIGVKQTFELNSESVSEPVMIEEPEQSNQLDLFQESEDIEEKVKETIENPVYIVPGVGVVEDTEEQESEEILDENIEEEYEEIEFEIE